MSNIIFRNRYYLAKLNEIEIPNFIYRTGQV
jgi:hypothetical protein